MFETKESSVTKSPQDHNTKNTDEREVIGANLKKIQDALELSQRSFASLLGISASTLNGHINGNTFPSIETLLALLKVQDLKKKNISFTLDDLIKNPDFDPLIQATFGKKRLKDNNTHKIYRDFLGTYLTYSYEQSSDENEKNDRDLRYGVVNIYENYSAIGEVTFAAVGRFFKAQDKESAISLKEKIDNLYTQNLSKLELLQNVKELMMENGECYTGLLSFGENHAFLSLDSREYNDRALLILHIPKRKRMGKNYIGGLGCVSSVTRGRHMPSAQKVIVSKYVLDKSKEEISSHLRILSPNFSTDNITHELMRLDKRLYSTSGTIDAASQFLSERDKQVIFDNRLRQLIYNFVIEKAFCVVTVSETDDRDVYTLIKQLVQK